MSMPAQLGLPHEVLTSVLEHLPQKELRNASQVSRGFYSSAHDAGLTLHHTVNTDEADTLDTFSHIVNHAQAQPQRFRLALSLVVYHRTGDSDSDGLPPWDDIWNTVRRAMPFLVSLHVILESDIMEDVFAALDAPAPYLRVFTVETIDMDGRCPSVQPPASLFGGSAPRLRGVELTGPALLPTGAPVPAWRAVRALKMLSSVPGQPVDVARFFPALRELVLVVIHNRENVPHKVDLNGLTLDSLTVINESDAQIQYTAPPARVGVLRDLSPAARYDATLWPDEEELTARIYQDTIGCARHRCDVLDVPGDLFGGEAPKLRRLVLDRFPLGQAPVPAVAQVTALHMICIFEIPDIEYAEHFPCLLDMHLAFHTTPRGAPTPASFRFGGLRLHRLVIEDLDFCTIIPAVIRSIDVSEVPVFEHVGTKLHPDDPLWKQQDPGALSLRIMRSRVHESRLSVLVVPAHRRWRRAYHMSPGHDEPCPISELPALLRVGQCVRYMRVIDDHVAALLETGWPDLAALRRLRVDCYGYGSDALVVWPPPQYTPYGCEVPTPERGRSARCPALETLTLATRNGAMVLETRHVVQFGGALAQCERDARERAALVLVGIELKQPADETLFRTAFSSVRFCAPNSSWDRDGGLWDEEH